MKKLSILFLSLVAMATSFTSCDDDDDDNGTPAPTVLQLTIKDEAGAVVPNCTVKLYASLEDLQGAKNQVGTDQNSGADGKVSFSNLQNIVYYFDLQAGCK